MTPSTLLCKIPVLLTVLLLVGHSAAAQDRPARCPLLPDPKGDGGSVGQEHTYIVPDDPSLDLRAVDMTSTSDALGIVVRVQKLARTSHQAYHVHFDVAGTRYVAAADVPPAGAPGEPAFTLAREVAYGASTPNGPGAAASASRAVPVAGAADVDASRVSFVVPADLLAEAGVVAGARLTDVHAQSIRVVAGRVFAQSDSTDTATYVFGTRGCVPMPRIREQASERSLPEAATPAAGVPAAAPAAVAARPPAPGAGPEHRDARRRPGVTRAVRWSDAYGDARMTGELQQVQTFSREDLDILDMELVAGSRGVSLEMALLGESSAYGTAYYGLIADPTTGCQLRVRLSGDDSASVSCHGLPATQTIALPHAADESKILRAFVPYDAFPTSISADRPLRVAGESWSALRPPPPPPPFSPGPPVPPVTAPSPSGDLFRHDVARTDQTLTRPRR